MESIDNLCPSLIWDWPRPHPLFGSLLDSIQHTHFACPLPLFDENGTLLGTQSYGDLLPGAVVAVKFRLEHIMTWDQEICIIRNVFHASLTGCNCYDFSSVVVKCILSLHLCFVLFNDFPF